MKLATAGEMVTDRIQSKQILHSLIIDAIEMKAELNIIIFNSRVLASTETRLLCFDIVWQEGRMSMTSGTDRDIPEA